MSSLEAAREVKVIVTMDEEYAGKLVRSIGRVMDALGHMDQQEARYQQLVNTHTIDDVTALRMSIINAMERSLLVGT